MQVRRRAHDRPVVCIVGRRIRLVKLISAPTAAPRDPTARDGVDHLVQQLQSDTVSLLADVPLDVVAAVGCAQQKSSRLWTGVTGARTGRSG